jgi:hypothetical protein
MDICPARCPGTCAISRAFAHLDSLANCSNQADPEEKNMWALHQGALLKLCVSRFRKMLPRHVRSRSPALSRLRNRYRLEEPMVPYPSTEETEDEEANTEEEQGGEQDVEMGEQETEQETVVNFITKISDVNKSSDLREAEIRLNKDLFTENATVYKLGKNGTPMGIVSIEDYLSEVSLLTRQMAFEVKDIVKNSDGKIIEFSIIEY